MLAYDLYLRNIGKKRVLPPPRYERPIRKIFVNKNTITLDSKSFEEYGEHTIRGFESLQKELLMPSSTSEKIGLPDCRTARKVPQSLCYI